jgi:membrane-bound serine protease (ClpP class)
MPRRTANAASRRVPLRAVLGLLCLGAALAGAQEAPFEAEPPQVATFVRLDGQIDGLTVRTLGLQVRQALEAKPRFLVVSIDSPGGELEASKAIAWNLQRLTEDHRVTTVAFVRNQALSGATMAALGCEMIAMAPQAALGDVLPIQVIMSLRGQQIALADKLVSPVRQDLERLATLRGYPVDAAAAMVDPDVELHRLLVEDERGRLRARYLSARALEEQPGGFRSRIQEDSVVCPKDKLLTIGPDEAQEMGMCRLQARDEEALCRALEVEFSIAKVTRQQVDELWWASTVRFITWWPVKTLLFVVGVICLLVSLAQPGTGAAEALTVVCFGAVFFGSYLIGLADWVEVILLLVGLALLAAEVFLTPGFGVLGGSGILCMGAALLLSFQRFVIPGDPIQWDIMIGNLAKTAFGGALTAVGIGIALRFLPKSRLLRGLMHEHTLAEEPLETASHTAAPVGALGVAKTAMRPVGKVEVAGEPYDARAQDGLLEAGTAVVVVGHQGHELVVTGRPEAVAKARAAQERAEAGAISAAAAEPTEAQAEDPTADEGGSA